MTQLDSRDTSVEFHQLSAIDNHDDQDNLALPGKW